MGLGYPGRHLGDVGVRQKEKVPVLVPDGL